MWTTSGIVHCRRLKSEANRSCSVQVERLSPVGHSNKIAMRSMRTGSIEPISNRRKYQLQPRCLDAFLTAYRMQESRNSENLRQFGRRRLLWASYIVQN